MADQKTLSWLKHLKIATNHINQTQIKNGYLFGLIFQRLNLSKGKKFTNNHDLPCIFQNYKNTKDLLYQNFRIDFPANQIIYRGNQLLQAIKDACITYENNKKQNTLNQIKKKYLPKTQTIQQKLSSSINNNMNSTLNKNQPRNNNTNALNNTLTSNNGTKLPKKILDIEKKLQKFKYQKTHQQLINLQTRRRQIQQINDVVQQHRHFQMSKVRMNHQQNKQLQKRVYEVVKSTQANRNTRIQKQQNFFRFIKSKKDHLQATIKNQQQKTFKNGLQDFQLNCMRQGIQLEHDPNKQFISKQQNFNPVVMMQRIKDNIKILQKQRKQRKKRQNNKAIQTLDTNAKSQKIWQQLYLVQDLQKKMQKQFQSCQKINASILVSKAQSQEIANKLKNKQQKPLPSATQQQKQEFQAKLLRNRLIYYDRQIERLERKQRKMKNIAQEVLQALLYTTIISEESQKNLNFTYTQWKSLQKIFVDFNYSQSSKRNSIKFSKKVIQPQKIKTFITYLNDIKLTLNDKQNEQRQLALLINRLIDNIYPQQKLTQKLNIPLYMPIRIGFTGTKLSGKTTQVKKLLTKYNSLVLIDPKKILTQALELARPPPINDDPKKKKQSKKPEQQTPEKLQLKKFGELILEQIKNQSTNPDQIIQIQKLNFKYFIKAIRFKLQKCFQQKTKKQVLQIYKKKKQQEQQRIKNFALIQQDKNKKKDSKKGPAVVAQTQTPIFNELFYIQGFVLDNVDLNYDNLKKIQKQLNGFISFDQRFNQEAQKLRQQLSSFIPISKTQKPDVLNKGFFNILIDLDAGCQSLQQRNQNRKIDPLNNQVYHSKFNPAPTDVKGLVERLVQIKKQTIESLQERVQIQQKRQSFYRQFGDDKQKALSYRKVSQNSIQDTYNQILKIFQQIIKIQYQRIKESQNQQIVQSKQEKVQQKNQNNISLSDNKPQNELNQTSNIEINKQQFDQNILAALKNPDLLKRFCQLTTKYQQLTIGSLQKLDLTRQHFQKNFLSEQKLFIEIINRPDDKAGKILTFQDNYNKLLDQKANILNDKSAINHLIQKLDELYDNLWVNLDRKKNQAIIHRKKFQSSQWMNDQAKQLVQRFKQLLQNQLNYLVDMLAFLLSSQLTLDGKNSEPVIDYLTLGVPKQLEPIQSIQLAQKLSQQDQNGISPRLDYYFRKTKQCLQSIQQWLIKKQVQSKVKLNRELQQLANKLIIKQKIFINSVISNLNQRNFSLVSQQLCYYKILVNKMDDWIIQGIKQQNDFIYNIYKQIKTNIKKLCKIYLKDLFPREITLTIKPIDYFSSYSQYIPLNLQFSRQTFDFRSFKIFLQQLRCLNEYKNQQFKISFDRFKQYFIKRKKSNLLNEIYLKLDFDKMQQYLVIDDEFYFKELAISLLLWNQKVIEQEDLFNYIKIVTKSSINNEKQNQQNNQQKQILANRQLIYIHLNQLNIELLFTDLKLSSKQSKALNHLVFDIIKNEFNNKVQIKQLIQILKVFSSLQVQKYGHCIMDLRDRKQ